MHICHAEGCAKNVPPRMLMCLNHWKKVPPHIQRGIWASYIPGQEIRKDPSDEYMKWYKQAVNVVAKKENRKQPFISKEDF